MRSRYGACDGIQRRGLTSHFPAIENQLLLEIMPDTYPQIQSSSRGFSLIEILVVLAIMSIVTAIAIPVMTSQRRLLRSTAAMREVMTRLRYARQLAMSTRQSVTFQYDDAVGKKQITIFNHHNNENNDPSVVPWYPVACNYSRTAILNAPNFPNTTCSDVVITIPLAQGGLTASEISYGIPTSSQLPPGAPTIPSTQLGDNVVMTPLTSGKINITFQVDGSVVDAAGIPLDRALYLFNNAAAQGTASAISVVGASGRAKVWRYSPNANKYIE